MTKRPAILAGAVAPVIFTITLLIVALATIRRRPLANALEIDLRGG